jgi:ATP-dependent Clp protease ATP-binding subunit ClpA
MSEAPENLVLALLRDMRGEIAELRSEMRAEFSNVRSELRSELRSLRADVASDMMDLEKRLEVQIAGLRRAVMEYHSSAIGHGVLITELDERLRRVEQRLDIAPERR